ncbi:MAG: hypothetical protein AABZ08_10370 [Planctomycetota bacterium]
MSLEPTLPRHPDKLLAIGVDGETVAAYRYLVLSEKAPTSRRCTVDFFLKRASATCSKDLPRKARIIFSGSASWRNSRASSRRESAQGRAGSR